MSQTCSIDGVNNFIGRESLISVHIAVMIVAILSLFASWKQIYEISKEYMIYKKSMNLNRNSIEDSKFKTNVDWKKNW